MRLGGRHKVVLVESRSSERAERGMSLVDLMEQVCRGGLTSLTEMKRLLDCGKARLWRNGGDDDLHGGLSLIVGNRTSLMARLWKIAVASR